MIRFSAAVLIVIAFTATVHADGIPFDREKERVTEPHTLLKLSAEQQTQVSKIRRLTLTLQQHQLLAKRCSTFPHQIDEVLSYRYGDCTCCVGHPYAILLPGGASIAVPHSEIEMVSRYGVRQRPSFAATPPAKARSRWSRFWKTVFRRS